MKVIITAKHYSETEPLALLTEAGYEIENYSEQSLDDEALASVLKNADAMIAGQDNLTRKLLEKCPELKLISRRGIGYDKVDLQACKDLGITVCTTRGTEEGAVAEQVMAYILYFARRVDKQSADMHNGLWNRQLTFGAKGRTLGLIGLGGIGKEIAARAQGFGMKVLYNCRHPRQEWETQYDVSYTDLDTLLAESDYISVNLPLNSDTERMFNRELFSKMKKGSYFLNIARGKIVDEYALKEALESGHLAGAGIDVFPEEPCTDSPLRGLPNVILTPHSSVFTWETYIGGNCTAAQNVIDYFNGTLSKNRIIV